MSRRITCKIDVDEESGYRGYAEQEERGRVRDIYRGTDTHECCYCASQVSSTFGKYNKLFPRGDHRSVSSILPKTVTYDFFEVVNVNGYPRLA